MSRRRQEQLRAMYAGGRGNGVARRYARFWNQVLRLGVLPRSLVTLEVAGPHRVDHEVPGGARRRRR